MFEYSLVQRWVFWVELFWDNAVLIWLEWEGSSVDEHKYWDERCYAEWAYWIVEVVVGSMVKHEEA